jgi:hypothetical protein
MLGRRSHDSFCTFATFTEHTPYACVMATAHEKDQDAEGLRFQAAKPTDPVFLERGFCMIPVLTEISVARVAA